MGNLFQIRNNFQDYGIINFTPQEIINTGADLRDVKLTTMHCLQQVRTKLNRRFHLIRNGLTTGNHVSPEHPNGEAVDFHLDVRDGPVTPDTIRLLRVLAIRAGFNGLGFYFNGVAYSFHLDLRPVGRYAEWKGTKDSPGIGSWKMQTIIGNTANIFT